MATYIDFMAPFRGAEQARAENNRINQYKNNQVALQKSTMMNEELMRNIQSNRQAADYLSTFYKNRDAALKAGLSPVEFLKAQWDTVMNDPTFNQFTPLAQQNVLKTLQNEGYKTAGELKGIGEDNQADMLLQHLGQTKTMSDWQKQLAGGNLTPALEARGKALYGDSGDKLNYQGVGDNIIDAFALQSSAGNIPNAQKLSRADGMTQLANEIMLQELSGRQPQQNPIGFGVSPGYAENATNTQLQTNSQPQNGVGVTQAQTPVAQQTTPTPPPSWGLSVSPLDETTLQSEILNRLNGMSATDYFNTQPADVQQQIMRLANTGNGLLTGAEALTFSPIDKARFSGQEDALRQYLSQVINQQHQQNQIKRYNDELLSVLNSGTALNDNIEQQALQQLMSAITSGDNTVANKAIVNFGNLLRSNPNAYNGAFNSTVQDYLNLKTPGGSAMFVESLRNALLNQ